MPDEIPPAGTVAPVVPAIAPAAPIVPAPPAAPPADPNWLAPRLDQAKRSGGAELLASLGVKDVAEAKAILDAHKATQDAAKSAEVRAVEATTRANALQSERDTLAATIKARADVELAGLDDAKRAAVKAIAGDDPARALSAIDALKPTWGAAPAPEAQAVKPAADTAPGRNAPDGAPPAQVDHKAEYARLKKTNPVAADAYVRAHGNEMYPAK